MGSFIGYIFPGTLFIFFGTYWTIQIIRRYLQSFMKNGKPFMCSVTYPARSGCFQNFDIDGIVLLVSAAGGIFLEIVLACILRHRSIGMENLQYATIYFFFGLVGLLSILSPSISPTLAEFDNLRFISLLLSFSVEAIVLHFHQSGKDSLEMLLNSLVLYTCSVSTVVTLLEMRYKDSVLAALSRTFLLLLQGSWLWQTAVILYWGHLSDGSPNRGWDHDSHYQLMLVVCFFAWHIAAIFILMLVAGLIIVLFYRRTNKSQGITEIHMSLLNNGYSLLLDQTEENVKEETG